MSESEEQLRTEAEEEMFRRLLKEQEELESARREAESKAEEDRKKESDRIKDVSLRVADLFNGILEKSHKDVTQEQLDVFKALRRKADELLMSKKEEGAFGVSDENYNKDVFVIYVGEMLVGCELVVQEFPKGLEYGPIGDMLKAGNELVRDLDGELALLKLYDPATNFWASVRNIQSDIYEYVIDYLGHGNNAKIFTIDGLNRFTANYGNIVNSGTNVIKEMDEMKQKIALETSRANFAISAKSILEVHGIVMRKCNDLEKRMTVFILMLKAKRGNVLEIQTVNNYIQMIEGDILSSQSKESFFSVLMKVKRTLVLMGPVIEFNTGKELLGNLNELAAAKRHIFLLEFEFKAAENDATAKIVGMNYDPILIREKSTEREIRTKPIGVQKWYDESTKSKPYTDVFAVIEIKLIAGGGPDARISRAFGGTKLASLTKIALLDLDLVISDRDIGKSNIGSPLHAQSKCISNSSPTYYYCLSQNPHMLPLDNQRAAIYGRTFREGIFDIDLARDSFTNVGRMLARTGLWKFDEESGAIDFRPKKFEKLGTPKSMKTIKENAKWLSDAVDGTAALLLKVPDEFMFSAIFLVQKISKLMFLDTTTSFKGSFNKIWTQNLLCSMMQSLRYLLYDIGAIFNLCIIANAANFASSVLGGLFDTAMQKIGVMETEEQRIVREANVPLEKIINNLKKEWNKKVAEFERESGQLSSTRRVHRTPEELKLIREKRESAKQKYEKELLKLEDAQKKIIEKSKNARKKNKEDREKLKKGWETKETKYAKKEREAGEFSFTRRASKTPKTEAELIKERDAKLKEIYDKRDEDERDYEKKLSNLKNASNNQFNDMLQKKIFRVGIWGIKSATLYFLGRIEGYREHIREESMLHFTGAILPVMALIGNTIVGLVCSIPKEIASIITSKLIPMNMEYFGDSSKYWLLILGILIELIQSSNLWPEVTREMVNKLDPCSWNLGANFESNGKEDDGELIILEGTSFIDGKTDTDTVLMTSYEKFSAETKRPKFGDNILVRFPTIDTPDMRVLLSMVDFDARREKRCALVRSIATDDIYEIDLEERSVYVDYHMGEMGRQNLTSKYMQGSVSGNIYYARSDSPALRKIEISPSLLRPGQQPFAEILRELFDGCPIARKDVLAEHRDIEMLAKEAYALQTRNGVLDHDEAFEYMKKRNPIVARIPCAFRRMFSVSLTM